MGGGGEYADLGGGELCRFPYIYKSKFFKSFNFRWGGGYNITYGGGSDDNLSLLGESFKLVHKIKAFQIFKVSTSIDIHTSSWFFSG